MVTEARQQAQAEEVTQLVAKNTTGYFGARLNKPGRPKPYQARVRSGGKNLYLGSFATAEEAALHVARSPEGRAAAAERAAAAPPLTSEEARQQAQAEKLTLLVAESMTGYFGVNLKSGQPKPYRAEVWRAGKMVHLGSFLTAEEAALHVARTPEGRAAAAKRAAALAPMTSEAWPQQRRREERGVLAERSADRAWVEQQQQAKEQQQVVRGRQALLEKGEAWQKQKQAAMDEQQAGSRSCWRPSPATLFNPACETPLLGGAVRGAGPVHIQLRAPPGSKAQVVSPKDMGQGGEVLARAMWEAAKRSQAGGVILHGVVVDKGITHNQRGAQGEAGAIFVSLQGGYAVAQIINPSGGPGTSTYESNLRRVQSLHAIDRELLAPKALSLYALCNDHAARYEERLYFKSRDASHPLEAPLSSPSAPPQDNEPQPRPEEMGGTQSHFDAVTEAVHSRGRDRELKLAGRVELRIAFVDWIGASHGGGAGSSAFCLCTRSNLGPGEERDQATVARWPRSMPGHGAWLPPHVFAQHTRAGKAVETRPQFAHYGATSAPMLLAELTLRESEQEGVKGLSPLARLLRARHVPLDWAHRVGWDGNGGGAVAVASVAADALDATSPTDAARMVPPTPASCKRPAVRLPRYLRVATHAPLLVLPSLYAAPPMCRVFPQHAFASPPSRRFVWTMRRRARAAVWTWFREWPPLMMTALRGGEHAPPFGHGSVSGHLS
jgi:hypothetical protein